MRFNLPATYVLGIMPLMTSSFVGGICPIWCRLGISMSFSNKALNIKGQAVKAKL